MRLPNFERATIDLRKLRDYALNPNHPEGRHKARVFLSSLGITREESEWLASALAEGLQTAEAFEVERTLWGTVYKVDMQLRKGCRCATVRTGWLCQGFATKLTTCFIVGECDETT